MANSLDDFKFAEYCERSDEPKNVKVCLNGVYDTAEKVLLDTSGYNEVPPLVLGAKSERLRWFVLPQEVSPTLSLKTANS